MRHLSVRIAVVGLVMSATPAAAPAQHRFPPDSFTNLKVLPKTIDQRTRTKKTARVMIDMVQHMGGHAPLPRPAVALLRQRQP